MSKTVARKRTGRKFTNAQMRESCRQAYLRSIHNARDLQGVFWIARENIRRFFDTGQAGTPERQCMEAALAEMAEKALDLYHAAGRLNHLAKAINISQQRRFAPGRKAA